jgi:class 3 adenylate cyclase
VLFADMVGFTAISERLSPEALVELLRAFHGCSGPPL